ncbi:ATP-binding protein [Streptomyces sp. NPDC047023]|uniref:ATP-binding protein n=1 Tax=Streptomyces sp. NPDC047023 TaxID=3155139 RepID=UPI0033F0F8DE
MSCAQAREAALRVLAEVEAPPDLAERALLVVTELVSNARRHAGGVTGFDVFCRDGRLTVAVSDRSTRSPRLRPPAPRLPGGFGWRLVKTLVPGTFIRFHRGGKTVIAPLPTVPVGA